MFKLCVTSESISKCCLADFSFCLMQNAIEVAAQCVDQAFQYASENLDSIGLPLTPRLAEYMR